MTNNWSTQETDDPLYADRRNFHKVEKWSNGWAAGRKLFKVVDALRLSLRLPRGSRISR
jgi:hypothetical protein